MTTRRGTAVLLLGVLLSLAPSLASADTQDRSPTGDGQVSGTWTGSAGSRYQSVDDYPDTTPTDYLEHGTTSGYLTFSFSAFTVPANSTITNLTIYWYDAEPSSGNNRSCAQLRVNGTNYADGCATNPSGTTYTSRSRVYTTNPATGSAWTVDEINGVAAATELQEFGFYSSDANPVYRVSSIKATVTYTPPVNVTLTTQVATASRDTLTVTITTDIPLTKQDASTASAGDLAMHVDSTATLATQTSVTASVNSISIGLSASVSLTGSTSYGHAGYFTAQLPGLETQTRAPTSDGGYTGTWTGTEGTRYTLVDDYPDITPTDYLEGGTTSGLVYFGFSPFTVPENSSNITLKVKYLDMEPADGTNNLMGRIIVNTVAYNALNHDPSGPTPASRMDTWDINPNTGSAWTAGDINGTSASPLTGFGIRTTDADPVVRASSVELQVTYSPPVNVSLTGSKANSFAGHLDTPPSASYYQTRDRPPTGDVSNSGTWSGSSPNRYTYVDDYGSYESDVDYLEHGTAEGAIRFSFAVYGLPQYSEDIKVMLKYYDSEPADGPNNFTGRIIVGGISYAGTPHEVAGTGKANRVDVWSKNPKTGLAWTVDDVNGTGSNPLGSFGFQSSDADPVLRLWSAKLAVTYVPPLTSFFDTNLATSSIDSLSVTAVANADLTTELATASAGDLVVSVGQNESVDLTTELATSTVGDLAVSAGATADLTTTVVTASVDDLAIDVVTLVPLTGNVAYGVTDYFTAEIPGRVTQLRKPQADYVIDNCWVNYDDGLRYTYVDDYPDPTGNDYVETTGGCGPGTGTLSFSNPNVFTVPANSENITIQAKYYVSEPTPSGTEDTNQIQAYLSVGGQGYQGTWHDVVGPHWTHYVDFWNLNPRTGLPWTVNQVNSTGGDALSSKTYTRSYASPVLRMSSLAYQVTYTPPTNVPLTTTVATSSINSFSVSAGSSLDLATTLATASDGTLAVSADAAASLTTTLATAERGTLTVDVSAGADVALTTTAATGERGTLDVSAGAALDLETKLATSADGTLDVSAGAALDLETKLAIASRGTLDVSAGATAPLETKLATASTGDITNAAGATADLTTTLATGERGDLTVGVIEGASVFLSTTSSTASRGTLDVSAGAALDLTTTLATSERGTLAVGVGHDVPLETKLATTDHGTLQLTAGSTIAATGEQAAAATSSLAIFAGEGVAVFPNGEEATSARGDIAVSGGAEIAPTGVASASAQSDLAVSAGVTEVVALTGEGVTGASGTVSLQVDQDVLPAGSFAVASIGTVGVGVSYFNPAWIQQGGVIE